MGKVLTSHSFQMFRRLHQHHTSQEGSAGAGREGSFLRYLLGVAHASAIYTTSRATRLGATGLRASEREICLWQGLWEDLWQPLKNLWKPLTASKTTKTSENFRKPLPLRDPLRGRFPSQRLLVLLPLFICPLNSLQISHDVCSDCVGALLNSTWNYNSHDTTTFECPNSTHRGPNVATTVKWRLLHLAIIERQKLHSQRPPNYNNFEPTAAKWRL